MKNRNIILVATLVALGFFTLWSAPKAFGVVPPPDGGYPNFTTAEGTKALSSLTTGAANTAVGWFSLFSNAGGSFNTATGAGALLFNTADQNTAFGAAALLFNTIGSGNTAVGVATLLQNTEGDSNVAIGANALRNNTTGSDNNAFGSLALVNNTTANFNNAFGQGALQSNETGGQNNAIGDSALFSNVDGTGNTALGDDALASNISGDSNTAIGDEALAANTGGENTAVGAHALDSNTIASGNVAIGFQALANNTTGSNNTVIGHGAGTVVSTANNVICIGGLGFNVSNSIQIGSTQTSTSIAGIFGATTLGGGVPVVVDFFGQLGTMSSSRRFKKEIKPMDNASEAILALRPVTFRYKSDKTNRPEFGLIAEEVADINPNLVVRDKNGEIYTVRYEAVNAMLLNEFLKEHRKVEDLKRDFQATVAQQQKEIAALAVTVKEQASQIQKVSAQIEASRSAPQTFANDQ